MQRDCQWSAGGGQELERSRLAPGLCGDLVILEGALDGEVPPRVSATWVADEPVFTAP